MDDQIGRSRKMITVLEKYFWGTNFEFDLKKIIALSTLRQLGLIMRIVSLGFALSFNKLRESVLSN